jgi:hypothetical protein
MAALPAALVSLILLTMHPKIAYPGDLAALSAELARPLHEASLREPARKARPGAEASLAGGYALDAADFRSEKHLEILLDDLRRFMSRTMGVAETPSGYRLKLVRREPEGCPPGAAEAHRILTSAGGCTLTARDLDGLRRAVFRLEDEMLLRRAPVLPLGEEARWTTVADRVTRSPIAPYRWLSGWELEDENEYYPEEYLSRLAHSGVNGIWVAGLFRNLVASKVIPELGPPRHRLGKLRGLVEKAARHGIKVWFFCMEPRALPLGHPAAAAHPGIVGAKTDIYECVCPSTPRVLDYCREAARDLFAEAPGLAGIIDLCKGERPTTCWWWSADIARKCPRCGSRPEADVLAQTLGALVEGMRASSPNAKLVAWPYMPYAQDKKTGEIRPFSAVGQLAAASRPEVAWMANFEHGGVKEICGKPRVIHEYSLSSVEAGPIFRDLARDARASGRHPWAKLQLGTTYELSSVPEVPVPGVVRAKFASLRELGATGAMLSWIVGGYPGIMLKAAGEAAFEPSLPADRFLARLAAIQWGERAAARAAAAWAKFEEAWRLYPFDLGVLYRGPLTRGPAYQFHLEREARLPKVYNWGFERDRTPQFFAYEPEKWLGAFTADEVVRSFRDMAGRWEGGLGDLKAALEGAGDRPELKAQYAVASGIRLHLLSAANVYEFYSLRDRLLPSPKAARPAILRRLGEVTEQEIAVAEEMRKWLLAEPFLGFESELYAWSCSAPLVDEKLRRARDVLATLRRWEGSGVEEAVLRRTVEEAESLRPDRWGD